ncbi:hypothetical protein TrVE_jg14375 [Triparma verrucosa]|uniref:Uncharacterized protein n=2 Tax=Triparma TaxID=722752 RepID=A0A9W6ZGY5_9STRA|nr:hypothetical protein TrST_g8226 [Triparma strigata]GMI06794.1 hypothetical protein TrVE_jg14375 [Triparma verrucosa]
MAKAKSLNLSQVEAVDEEGEPEKADSAEAAVARKAEFEKTIGKMGATRGQDRGREVFEYTSNTPPKVSSPPSPSKSVKVPLLGTIDVDGSLLVVIPAAVIGALGVLTSIYIGLTSTDDISRAMQQMREEEQKTKTEKQSNNNKSCRGLCFDQNSDLELKQQRMEGKSGTEKALSIFF